MAFRVKEVILGTSIAILFVIFVAVGINVFYKSPKYEDFCKTERTNLQISAQKACEAAEGKWNAAFMEKPVAPEAKDFQYICTRTGTDSKGQTTLSCINYQQEHGYCDLNYYCSQKFNDSLSVYNRNVFIISGIIGILAIILGAMLQLVSVSAGLFGGGVLTLIYGTVRYWSELADWARFIIIGIALVVLIYLGYRLFGKSGAKKKR